MHSTTLWISKVQWVSLPLLGMIQIGYEEKRKLSCNFFERIMTDESSTVHSPEKQPWYLRWQIWLAALIFDVFVTGSDRVLLGIAVKGTWNRDVAITAASRGVSIFVLFWRKWAFVQLVCVDFSVSL